VSNLYHRENMLHFYEMAMMLALY